jgi:stress response protein YsnF
MNTIVALFENTEQAVRAKSALSAMGIAASEISHYDRSTIESSGQREQTFWESMKDAFGFGEDSRSYEEGVRRGGTLLSVRVNEEREDKVADILSDHGAVDLDTREAEWRGTSGSGAPASASSAPIESTSSETIPVVEEELKVGKRARQGKVRVYRTTTARPVEETVRLRDEKVRVERRPASGRVTSKAGAFDETIVEETEIHEEPVVEKQARVVEDVTVHKDVREREATIRDTVRRSDVRVDEKAGSPGGEDDYRRHWTTHYKSAQTPYDDYSIAYRFGGTLPHGQDWTLVEPEARRQWEHQRPGTWDRFKDAVRFSWEKATNRRAA